MKDRDKFVVAVKDTTKPGSIRQGKVLGKFRTREFAGKALPSLVRQSGVGDQWRVGIFLNGILVS